MTPPLGWNTPPKPGELPSTNLWRLLRISTTTQGCEARGCKEPHVMVVTWERHADGDTVTHRLCQAHGDDIQQARAAGQL